MGREVRPPDARPPNAHPRVDLRVLVMAVSLVVLLLFPGLTLARAAALTPRALPSAHMGTPLRVAMGHPSVAPLRLHAPTSWLNGIDVSSYQGSINWGAVAGAGYTFAFAKASQGDYYTDAYWSSNAVNGKAAGVYIGAYDFADPVNVGATTEANYFDSVAGPYFTTGYMYPALDLEQGCGTLSVSALSSWVDTWMSTVSSYISTHDGFTMVPTVYMNSNYANNCVDSSVTAYPLWIAEYCGGCTPNTGIFPSWSYYQYYDCGSIPGIGGCVDVDYFGGDLSALQTGFVFGSSAPTASYAMYDRTTSTTLYCGGSFSTGDTIQFTASVSGGTPPYTYAWSFGDGSTGSGNPTTHIYRSLGTVNPILTVTDAAGKTATSGSGCDFTVTGTPITFYTSPSNVGTITLGSSSFTNGQSTAVPVGQTFPLSVSAPGGYVFSGWSSTGGVQIAAPNAVSTQLTTTSSAAATVTVSFVTRSAIHFVSSPASDASAEVGGSVYTSGQNITASVGAPYPLLALPNPGYVFLQWQTTGGGISVQNANQAWTNLTVLSTAPSVLTEVVLWNAPKPPTGLGVIAETTTTITLAWTPPPGTLVSYTLGSSTGAVPPTGGSGFTLASFTAGGNTHTLTGLAPGTEYWLALAAVNSTGQGQWSTWVSGTTLPLPQSPLDLAVEQVGANFAILTWQAPTGGASITSTTLNCSTKTPSAADRLLRGIPPSSTVFNVTGLTPGAAYSCTAVSVSGTYASGPSNAVDFNVPPGPTTAKGPPPSVIGTLLSPIGKVALVAAMVGVLVALGALLFLRRRRQERPSTSAKAGEATLSGKDEDDPASHAPEKEEEGPPATGPSRSGPDLPEVSQPGPP